jgi:hypothetical protein
MKRRPHCSDRPIPPCQPHPALLARQQVLLDRRGVRSGQSFHRVEFEIIVAEVVVRH